MKYTPEPTPLDVSQIPEYLNREFNRMAQSLDQAGDYEVTYVEPSRKYEGMVRYADGSDWNPGAGKGLYVYDGTAWVKL